MQSNRPAIFKCSRCPFEDKSYAVVLYHCKNVHSVVKQPAVNVPISKSNNANGGVDNSIFCCPQCDFKIAGDPVALLAHMKSCHENNKATTAAVNVMPSKSNNAIGGMDDSIYCCPKCDFKIRDPVALLAHMKSHHENKATTAEPSSSKAPVFNKTANINNVNALKPQNSVMNQEPAADRDDLQASEQPAVTGKKKPAFEWARQRKAVLFLISKVKERRTELSKGYQSQLFKHVAREMQAKDYMVDSIQCQVKWKNLKSGYQNYIKTSGRSGNGAQTLDFFNELDEILFEKPEIIPNSKTSSHKGHQVNQKVREADVSLDEEGENSENEAGGSGATMLPHKKTPPQERQGKKRMSRIEQERIREEMREARREERRQHRKRQEERSEEKLALAKSLKDIEDQKKIALQKYIEFAIQQGGKNTMTQQVMPF